GATGWPSSSTVSSRSTKVASPATSPFTRTRPERISSSAPRREATPARARYAFNRTERLSAPESETARQTPSRLRAPRRRGLSDPADLHDPLEPCVVELTHFLHALHEERELLELRPLVVDGRDRSVDDDRFANDCHPEFPFPRWLPPWALPVSGALKLWTKPRL